MDQSKYEKHFHEDPDYPFFFHLDPAFSPSSRRRHYHWHESIELLNCVQGDCRAILNGKPLPFRQGDTVIVESISRIARNTRDLLSIISELTEKGVEFVSLKENIDTTTPHGRFMLTVFGALAELERESILERQREGIEIAKAEGKYKGRKPVPVDETKFRAVCARWRAGEITATAAMKEVGLKQNTFYRRVKELGL